jgi:hypothetical protein
MARELGAERRRSGRRAERLRAFDLEKLEHLQFSHCRNCEPCEELADPAARNWTSAAVELSDWLGMRYFTHVGDVSRQTMAL